MATRNLNGLATSRLSRLRGIRRLSRLRKREDSMDEQNDNMRDRLRAAADRGYPQAWIPEEPGDEIAGVVTSVRPAAPTAYGSVPVVELEELGGPTPWSVWLVHAVLRREFVRQSPQPGEAILIRYLGKVQPEGGGAAYESYKLVVDRPTEGNEVDWTRLAARYDPDLLAGEPSDRRELPPLEDEDVPF